MTKHDEVCLRFMAVQAGASLMQLRDMIGQTEELHTRLSARYADELPGDIAELAADLSVLRSMDELLARFIGVVGAAVDLSRLKDFPQG